MPGTYDAIVIGAGPAGCTVAADLARLGYSVLLLERKTIPRDKPCGGGLTPRAWKQIDVPIDDLVLHRATSVQVRVGAGISARFNSREASIWMVSRRDFDQRLAEEAVRRGAILHDCEPAMSIQQNPASSYPALSLSRSPALSQSPTGFTVTTSLDRYTSKVLVGADGAESKVARLLGIERPRCWMVGLDVEYEVDDDPLRGEAIVDLGVPYGYAWVFPKGRVYNVGLGTFSPAHARDLRRLLGSFAQSMGVQGLADQSVPVGHRIPVGMVPGPLHRGNALVVGDATAVADPLFAEGISYSILSGRLAAGAIAQYLTGRSPDLAGYTRLMRDSLGMDMRLWSLTARLVHRFPGVAVRFLAATPWLQHLVERTIAGEVRSEKSEG